MAVISLGHAVQQGPYCDARRDPALALQGMGGTSMASILTRAWLAVGSRPMGEGYRLAPQVARVLRQHEGFS